MRPLPLSINHNVFVWVGKRGASPKTKPSLQSGRLPQNPTPTDYITKLFGPGEMSIIDSKKVKSVEPSKTSMMSPDLLNILNDEDILDLTAYVLSAGDPKHHMFAK